MKNLTTEQMAELIENQRRALEAKEQQAIENLIGKNIDDKFKEFPRCMKCGKQKPHDNYPMCNECFQATDQALQQEDQAFIKGEFFAGMNHVNPQTDEDDFTNLMSNIDKYIK